MVGDWLVSYASGFVRRGLSGETLLFVGRRLGIPANMLVFSAVLGTIGLFCLALTFLFRRKRLTFWFVVLCLSPTCLLFTFYNAAAVGRKDTLILAAFAWWAVLSRPLCTRPAFWPAIAVGSFLLTLTHEMFLFFSPYFVFLAFLAFRQGGTRGGWRASLLIPAFSALAVTLIFAYSGPVSDPALCERLVSLGAPSKVCNGILAYQDLGLMPALDEFIGHFDGQTFQGLALVFPLLLIPVYLCLISMDDRALTPGQITGVIAGFIVFSWPLFVLALDWGRWMSIHTILSATTCACLLPAAQDFQPPVPHEDKRTPAYLALGMLILAGMFCWSVDYCCGASYLHPFGPKAAWVSAWNNLNF